MKICCLLNEKSGPSTGPTRQQIVEMFGERGVTARVVALGKDIDIEAVVQTALNEKMDIIVAGGGDGTVNAVASALLKIRRGRLGILPLGTLNHLAKDLKIPLALPDAVNVVCQANEDAIDAAQVNDAYFVNNSSLGLYPTVVRLREKMQHHGHNKWWAAAVAAFRALSKFRRVTIEIKLQDGNTIRRRTSLLFVGNNAYFTYGTQIGTRPSLKTGALWVGVSTSQTRWGLVKSFLSLVYRRESAADLIHFDALSLEVDSHKKLLPVAADGEVLKLSTPLLYTMLHKALRVIVPSQQADQPRSKKS